MSKFKIGDKVRVMRNQYGEQSVGDIGEVTALSNGGKPFVKFDGGGVMHLRHHRCWDPNALMLVFRRFQVGDKVRRTASAENSYVARDLGVVRGGVYEVTAVDGAWIQVDGKTRDAHYLYPLSAKNFELVAKAGTSVVSTNSILDTAKQLIEGSRAKEYGSFAHNAQQQSDLWNAYLSDGKGGIRKITPMDVPAMMVLVKLMRLSGNTSHQDSWVDVAGFAGLAEQVHGGTVGAVKPDGVPADAVRVRTTLDPKNRHTRMIGELGWAYRGAGRGYDVRFDNDGVVRTNWIGSLDDTRWLERV